MAHVALPYIHVNGAESHQVSVLDRGFTYGDGLFETCLFKNGEIKLWAYHQSRLLESANRLAIPLDLVRLNQQLIQFLEQLIVHQITSAVIKITVTRGEGGRGYGVPVQVNPTFVIAAFDAPAYPIENFREGVAVKVCNTRLSKNPHLAGLKHLNRLEQILARSEWQSEYAEGICLDVDGLVVEGVFSNLFWGDKQGKLFTPNLHYAGVKGVMRSKVFDACEQSFGIKPVETFAGIDELLNAEEIFMTNSLYGIWPVKSVQVQDTIFQFPSSKLVKKIQTVLDGEFA